MSDVFLSYSHEDRDRVRPVVARLEAQGWSVWWDRKLLPGREWEKELCDELKNCRAVVVVWTQRSVQSDWVKLEASAGLKIDGLVPIQLDRFETAPIPSEFIHIHAADLTGWDGTGDDSEFESLLSGVQEIILRPATAPSLANSTSLPYTLSLGGDLGSSDPRDIVWIAKSVEENPQEAAPALLAALQFPEPARRGHAAYLLSLTGNRTVVGSLAPLLTDRAELHMDVGWLPTVRAAAAITLKKIGTMEALRALADEFE